MTGISGEVLAALRCPVCAAAFDRAGSTVRCATGHTFDIARQGHLTLRTGEALPANADSPAMVEARERRLATGHYDRIAARTASLIAEHAPAGPGLVLDLAGGTGHYLAAVLDQLPSRRGLCLELSTAALKRAARAHPRAAAVGTDLRRTMPVADASAAVVMSVFGPRNIPEIRRVLVDDGLLAVVTPTPDHLHELIEPLGMLHVDAEKQSRLDATLAEFSPVVAESLAYRASMDHAALTALVAMGPSAHHVTAREISARVSALAASVDVTVSVRIAVYRR